jgi:hypothetical protein
MGPSGPQEQRPDERHECCAEFAQVENCTDGASRVASSVSK